MNYLKLIRWKNVLMVAATVALTWYGALVPFMAEFHQDILATKILVWLIAASSLIAAGGYVINDIYDVRVDHLNKPSKVIVGKHLTEKSAWALYLMLTATGAAAGVYLGVITESFLFGLFFFFVIGALWLYSMTMKKMYFIGNLLIALLSAATVFITMIAFFLVDKDAISFTSWFMQHRQMGAFVSGYTLFAFTSHLVRELLKDIEDADGDKAFGSSTIPVVSGKKKAVRLAQLINASILLGAVSAQLLLFHHGFNLLGWLVFLIIGLIILSMIKVRAAQSSADFRRVGNIIKILMLVGILSMSSIPFMV